MKYYSVMKVGLLMLLPVWSIAQKGKQLQGEHSNTNSVFHNSIPGHLYNIILSRPTTSSVTISVLANENLDGYFVFGKNASHLNQQTQKQVFKKANTAFATIDNLDVDSRYYYRFIYDKENENNEQQSAINTFHTQRKKDEAFVFTIQADSHLDENTDPKVYEQTLKNMASDSADFLVDLGDTWMTDKYRDDYKASEQQYIAQRYYFGTLCKSSPLFLTLGNHDGELGSGRKGNEMMAWASDTRTSYYANPFPNGFYTGNVDKLQNGRFAEDYYAWGWGSALFIVLDPFRYTFDNRDPWQRSLGEQQYNWLKTTLQNSKAKFKFVFIHNLVGGVDNKGVGRGGAEAAPFYEWGGWNKDSTNGFTTHRSGWDKPIHDLFVEHKVNVVFHGHDHLFAKQDMGNVIYQLLPQPGAMHTGNTNSAKEYGYTSGTILNSAGYLRVSVNANEAKIEFVQTNIDVLQKNKTVLFSYTIN